MKKKSNKLRRLEKNRKSVFFDSFSMCCNCGSMHMIDKNEIYPGRNRQNSMKYGMVIPLCRSCHRQYDYDVEFYTKWKRKGQKYFEENIGTREDFIKIFRRSYL